MHIKKKKFFFFNNGTIQFSLDIPLKISTILKITRDHKQSPQIKHGQVNTRTQAVERHLVLPRQISSHGHDVMDRAINEPQDNKSMLEEGVELPYISEHMISPAALLNNMNILS